MTASARGDTAREVDHETGSVATDTTTVHDRVTAHDTMTGTINADTGPEAASTSDEKTVQSVQSGQESEAMRHVQESARGTEGIDAIQGADHHTRGLKGGEIEERYSFSTGSGL
jgi:hypothetical protein